MAQRFLQLLKQRCSKRAEAYVVHHCSRGQVAALFRVFDTPDPFGDSNTDWLLMMYDSAYSDRELQQMKQAWSKREPPEDNWNELSK